MMKHVVVGLLYAWILWSHSDAPEASDRWVIEAGFETRAECTVAADLITKHVVRKLRGAAYARTSGLVTVINHTIGNVRFTYKHGCFPEAVDPNQ